MIIRPATVEDANGIAHVNAQAWKQGFRGAIDDEFLDAFDGLPQQRHDDLANPQNDDTQLVAVEGGKVVGWIVGKAADDEDLNDAYSIAACYVHPDYWRHGIGRALMAELLGDIDSKQWTQIVLWTARDTPRSIAFYESLGFVLDGHEKIFERGSGMAIVRMTKPCHPPA